MTVWPWISVGALAWFGASLAAGVFASRIAALATPDGTFLMWREPKLLSESCRHKPRGRR